MCALFYCFRLLICISIFKLNNTLFLFFFWAINTKHFLIKINKKITDLKKSIKFIDTFRVYVCVSRKRKKEKKKKIFQLFVFFEIKIFFIKKREREKRKKYFDDITKWEQERKKMIYDLIIRFFFLFFFSSFSFLIETRFLF